MIGCNVQKFLVSPETNLVPENFCCRKSLDVHRPIGYFLFSIFGFVFFELLWNHNIGVFKMSVFNNIDISIMLKIISRRWWETNPTIHFHQLESQAAVQPYLT